jgi:hypothetical protein
MESMMQAWLSSSEMMMSPGLAARGEEGLGGGPAGDEGVAASTPRNSAMVCSSSSWGVKVPQMNRTEAVPPP